MYGLEDCPVDYEKLSASVKLHEGLRNLVYIDSTGNLTIGYGRALSIEGISNDEAEYLLRNDLLSRIGTAQAQNWWQYVKDNDTRARAFIEIAFNLGFKALSSFHDAIDAASRGDWAACGAAFLDSLWHRQVGKRAEILASMVITGNDPS